MKETDQYYLYYEKLMKMAPQAAIEDTPEYQALAARYPHLSESIKARKELQMLNGELKSAKEKSTRHQIHRKMKNLVRDMRRLDVSKRLHGESGRETKYRRRFAVAAANQRLASMAQQARTAYTSLQNKLEEQSRKARLSRASKLPPSLFDLRSLDSTDRGLALREWVENRRIKTKRQRSFRSLETKGTNLS